MAKNQSRYSRARRRQQVIATLRAWIPCGLLTCLLAGPPAFAQNGPNDAVYSYKGADRDARLLERAKREGKLVLYTSLAPTESLPLAQAFEKKTGVKVEVWRGLSDKVVQRAVTESQARRHAVDVVETNGPEMEMMAREKVFSQFYSPHTADLSAAAIPAHRLWMPDRLNFFVVAFNTDRVRREEIPATYEGFLDAKWKARLGMEATDAEWMAALVKKWGPDKGRAFFRQLAAQRPDMRKGHILLAELVGAGEVPVALTCYQANIETLKRKGAPIDWLPVEPVIGRPQGIALARFAPHPGAALLFADFVLSGEGQELFNGMGRAPANVRVKSHLADFAYFMMDPATVIDEAGQWEKQWNELFLRK